MPFDPLLPERLEFRITPGSQSVLLQKGPYGLGGMPLDLGKQCEFLPLSRAVEPFGETIEVSLAHDLFLVIQQERI